MEAIFQCKVDIHAFLKLNLLKISLSCVRGAIYSGH